MTSSTNQRVFLVRKLNAIRNLGDWDLVILGYFEAA
jgi:hypothetical protein